MPPPTDSYRPRSEGSYDFQTVDVKQGYAQHTNEVYNVGIPPRGPPSLPPGPPSFPSDPTSLPPGPPSLPTDPRSLPPGPPSHSYSEGSQYLQH
ncbi:hypothetical protein DICVIV_04514 [Dictyocaulus viviparus]|uniref:Uncharacterized protein n=1 Tax=Dictyocaulus viviparus TaxID=29172 RepID=A0A0D8Y025_DICVI|nr:hypothetical protein DICVIV_04514 [Dictyocaulus viviparus]